MKKLLLPVLVAFAMVGCQEANEPISLNGPQEIKLYAGVSQMVAETKGTIDDFEKDAVIGIYAMKEGITDWTTPYFDNATGATKIGDADVVVFPSKVYYPQDDKKVTFYAFYPVGTPKTNAAAAPTVAYTLTGEEDILWTTSDAGKLSDKKAGELNFAHKLAKVNFKAIAGAGFATGTSVTKIVINGTHTAATLDVETGALTFSGGAAPITPVITAQAIDAVATPTFGEVMIEPGSSYTVTVTAGSFDYTTKTFTAPAAGQAHTITLTFLPTILNASAIIAPWNQGTDDADNLIK